MQLILGDIEAVMGIQDLPLIYSWDSRSGQAQYSLFIVLTFLYYSQCFYVDYINYTIDFALIF